MERIIIRVCQDDEDEQNLLWYVETLQKSRFVSSAPLSCEILER